MNKNQLPQYSKPSVGKMFFVFFNFFVFNKEKWKVVSKSHQGFKKNHRNNKIEERQT